MLLLCFGATNCLLIKSNNISHTKEKMKNMHKIIRPLVVLVALLTVLSMFGWAQDPIRQSEVLNNHWKFFKGDLANCEQSSFNDTQWENVDLPHDWSVSQPLSPSLASAAGFLPGGIGWYRKTFIVDSNKKGKEIHIYFEGVSNNSEVFINGRSLGKRPNGYISFSYDLSPYLNYGGANVLAVRVDRTRYNDSRWYAGSGITRNVYLNTTDPLHLQEWGTNYYTHSIDRTGAKVTVSSTIQNNTEQDGNISLLQQVYDRTTNKLLAQARKSMKVKAGSHVVVPLQLKVSGVQPWSTLSPNLYTLKTSVIRDQHTIDEELTTVGFRTFRFDANKGFALNGHGMKLKGVCLHHDAGVLGAAVPRQVWERRLKTLKELGCNAIRTSHNPQNPDLYDLCDELGLLVMDEGFDEWKHAKKKWVQGWNVGTPGYDGYAPDFVEWGERDLADLILRDRRHPSIIMWSIGNEVDYPNDPYSHPVLDTASIGQKVFGGYLPGNPDAMELGVIARKLAGVVKMHDTTRPVTAALAGVVMSNFTGYPEALDVAGYNYTENRYIQDHATYPNRIIYGSENRHDLAAWKAARDSKNICGQFLWTGIDYLGESGPWPSRGFYSGLLDFAGFLKPLGYFRRALWADTPVVYIGTYKRQLVRRGLLTTAPAVWNYDAGDTIRVVAYTNCPQAKLLLNGTEAGMVKDYDEETGIIYWDVVYQPGKLEVVALKEQKTVATHAIQTSGRPYRLIAAADKPFSKAGDVVHVTVTVVDENNIPVVLADNNITCTVSGPAKLLGLEGGDNRDMGDYTDNIQRAWQGRLLGYFRSMQESGPVKVVFSSPLLQSAVVEL